MKNDPPLLNKGLKFRALEPDDALTIYLWENQPELWLYGVTKAPLSLAQIQSFISQQSADPFKDEQLRMMICDNGQSIGLIDLYDISSYHLTAKVGIFIAPEHRNSGKAMTTLRRLMDYSSNVLGLKVLCAEIPDTNLISIRAFTNSGFCHAGTIPLWLKHGNERRSMLIFTKTIG